MLVPVGDGNDLISHLAIRVLSRPEIFRLTFAPFRHSTEAGVKSASGYKDEQRLVENEDYCSNLADVKQAFTSGRDCR